MKTTRPLFLFLAAVTLLGLALPLPAQARCNGHKTKWCFDHYWGKRNAQSALRLQLIKIQQKRQMN
jgi:hypothetical protein